MELVKYAMETRRRIESFLLKKSYQAVTTYRCCIAVSSREVSIICVNKTASAVELLFAEVIPYTNLGEVSLTLASIVKQHQLAKIPVYWLLAPEEYQLFLVDSLPVKDEEVRDALNWRIRSLINFPIDEAAIDYFSLPAKKSSPTNFMIAAVVAKTELLAKIAKLFEHSGLQLTVIDIPELAMRNLTAVYENDEKSTAFIYFYEKSAILNITCNKTLFFSRHIKPPTTTAASAEDYEQFSLEVTRYFDYFQNQWRYARHTRVFIASSQDNVGNLAKILSDYLLLPVEPFPITFILPEKMIVKNQQLLMLGSSLREELGHVTSGN